MLRKKYFDCPQRDSHVLHYIEEGEEVCTLVLHLASCIVLSCTAFSVRIVTKSPKVGVRRTSTYILHLSSMPKYLHNTRPFALYPNSGTEGSHRNSWKSSTLYYYHPKPRSFLAKLFMMGTWYRSEKIP
jgi:hypothetical protein